MKKRALLMLSVWMSVTGVFAHSLWIEPRQEAGYSILHGEPGEGGVVEKGKELDPYQGLKAWDTKGKEAKVVRKKSGFQVVAEPGGLVAVNRDGPVKEGVKAFQYLRFTGSLGEAEKRDERMDLAIVTKGSAGKVVVLWKGKPAAGAWLGVTAPNGWSRWYQAGKDGSLKVEMPWPGLYVLTAHWEDASPGGEGAGAYKSSSHLSSLSFTRP